MGSPVWQINQNTLVDFSNNCPGLIDKTYNMNDILLKDKEIKAAQIDKDERNKNKNRCVPDNLIRHQFMGLLVKVAKDKYVRCIIIIYLAKIMPSLVDAVNHSFENHYMAVIKDYEWHSWRTERYYNEYVDNVIKAYLPIFDAVYKSHAPRKDPGRREYINYIIQYLDGS